MPKERGLRPHSLWLVVAQREMNSTKNESGFFLLRLGRKKMRQD
jgi:hypothetical protein